MADQGLSRALPVLHQPRASNTVPWQSAGTRRPQCREAGWEAWGGGLPGGDPQAGTPRLEAVTVLLRVTESRGGDALPSSSGLANGAQSWDPIHALRGGKDGSFN